MTDIQTRNLQRHGKGKINIVPLSGLRKRMRAERRGVWSPPELPPKRMALALARHVHPRRLRSIA